MKASLQTCRRRLHTQGREAGITLVELLVVSIVSTILLGCVGVLFSGSLNASQKATAHTAATAEARLALDVVARRLRVAVRPSPTVPVIVEATPTSITFHASLSAPGSTADPAPSQVHYVLDATTKCLRETITPLPPALAPTRSSCLAFGDIVPAFSYFQVAKRPTLTAPSPSPVPTDPMVTPESGLSAEDREKVGAVGLTLAVRDMRAPAGGRPVEVTTRILLVNKLNEEKL